MAVRVNMPQRQNVSRGIQAPQIQARGRQLQAAAPAPPKQDWSAVGKSMMGLANQLKESRQKANRAKLVQGLVQEDDMGEGEAFNATVPQVQADGMEGMMQDSGVMGGPSAPATPKASRLSQLNMPDQAKAIFKEAVKSGDTDTAYKIAMKFALQPAKEYKLGKDDVVTDATGKIIAQGPASTPKPEKPVKAYNSETKQEEYATPTQINNNPNLQASAPPDKISDIQKGEISADIQGGMSMPKLIEKYGRGVVTAYGNAQVVSQQQRTFFQDGKLYTEAPQSEQYFQPLPQSMQEKRRAVIQPPNANSNTPNANPNVNSNMPIIDSSAGAPPSNNQPQKPKGGTISVVETPLVQTKQDQIQMQKAGQMVNEVRSLTGDYRKLVTEYGPQMLGPEAEKMSQAHTFLLMKLKDLLELGVLAGPDLDLLEKLVTPPDSKSLNFQDAVPFNGYDGTQVMLSQLDQLDKVVSDKYKAFEQNYGAIEKRISPVEPNVSAPKPTADTSGWTVNLKKN